MNSIIASLEYLFRPFEIPSFIQSSAKNYFSMKCFLALSLSSVFFLSVPASTLVPPLYHISYVIGVIVMYIYT